MDRIVIGQVIHKRSLSKKLMFIDIAVSNSECRLTVVFKLSVCGQEVMTRASKSESKIHVGDRIKVEGALGNNENDQEILANNFIVLERWSDVSNTPFVSIPPIITSSSSDGNKKVGVCKYWKNTGKCPLGSSCAYSHKATVVDVEELNKDPHCDLSRHNRSRVFADWITKVFKGVDDVLDVGGGKGDMAFELGLRRCVKCSVVDPRNPKKFETKILPKWQRKILAKHPNFDYAHFETEFNASFCAQHWTSSDKRDNQLVIGMHPDEATEPIIDLCLQFQRPFAVVPCCVFAHQFPNRRLKNGLEPRTYEQFCEYLIEKHSQIQRDQLNFKGRNTVLFLQHFGAIK